MRAVDYDRVSTDEQVKEGHSLEGQQDRNISFIHSQSWDYLESYIDDGYSAKDLKRPAMKRLLKDVELKKFDVVVVYRLDRLVRTVTDLHFILNHFDKHGVLFKSVTEIYDTTTAMGRFFITLVAAIAQWERENLAERVRMGMEENFLKGGWNGGEPPYGFKVVDGMICMHDEDHEEHIRTAYILKELKTRGGSSISKQLNREGKLLRSGSLWTDFSIGSIVHNPIYSGRRTWGKRTTRRMNPGKELELSEGIPSYLTPSEHDELLTIRKRRFVNRERTESDYPFTGVTRCHRCGNRLHGSVKKNSGSVQRYYKCYGRFTLGTCDLPIISEDTLEKLLLDKLDIIMDSRWTQEVAVSKETPSEEIRNYQKEFEEIQRRKKKWQFAFANDGISLDDLKLRMTEENAKLEEIKEFLEVEAAPEAISLTRSDIMGFAKEIKKNWEFIEPSHKKAAIHALFDEIVVNAIGPAIGGPGRRVACEITSVKTK